jgi:hypothetical protein
VSIGRAGYALESEPKMHRQKSGRGNQAALKERIKGIAETGVRCKRCAARTLTVQAAAASA